MPSPEPLPSPASPSSRTAGAPSLLRRRPFLVFFVARSLSRFASQIAAMANGWLIYDLTGSAFYLGLAGLTQFLPTALLVFVAGHAVDRYDRRRVMQLCQIAEGLTAVWLVEWI
jgi:MFS family permease